MAQITKLALSAVALGLGASLALSGCAAGGPPQASKQPGEKTVIRFAWWGNDTRNKITTQVIEAYEAANPDVDIQGEPTDGGSYWDKVATQVAANDMPDVIQMDEKYISEYGKRGALMDLSSINTADFAEGTVELGEVGDKLVGINIGVNAPALVANPKVFADAGVDLPDDATWTWEDFHAIAKQISAKGGGQTWGSVNPMSVDSTLKAWLRQHGKEQWTAEGQGYTADDVTPFFAFFKELQDDGTFAGASVTAEDEGKALDQTLMATNRVGMATLWSNQLTTMDKATGQDLKLLALPSTTGQMKDAGLWYKAAMYWSASARTKNADEVKKFIDYLSNSTEAGAIMGTERGFPPNLKVREAIAPNYTNSDKKVVAYLDAIQPNLGPTSVVPPQGGGQSPEIQKRHAQNVEFDRGSPASEAKGFHDEVKSVLK
ncbi:extracellular solute-binding protein [Propioniciclava coleopterorum]|uniref:Extracellular solute-binding protein n=1 Tax=Propioniciclava coleopterorum TaxID=2714937 RepID=A0A6G7Y2H0_9ACTN|nr:extracellular solute-binding protein [Propioniciclava coleopterorum]QIK71074.1 extracellular solute-binding protein [Propioniciclava coleopterorum]